jgi:septal ring factor EnvC (AmiA/AmiB activator)
MLRSLIVASLLAFTATAAADQRSDTQQQLEAARKDIAELKQLQEKLQQEKSGVQKDLRDTEKQMGDLEKQIDGLEQQIDHSQSELKRLDEQKKQLDGARLEQQRLIGIQARSAYESSGRGEYLRLLLNQQNPEKFARTLTYYDYLSKARLQQLAGFNETLRQLSNVEQQIADEQNQLNEQKQSLDARRDDLAQARKQRQQALAKLDQDYASQDRKLKAREQDQAKLGELLKTIEETLARQAREAEEAQQRALAEAREREQQDKRPSGGPSARPDDAAPLVSSSGASYGGPFGQALGKLPWPVNGRIVARFGSPRGDDPRAKWDGVLIGATAGTPVRAVHGGRVVFADWLRGAGLLVILDHGGGYLSLYGHNQSLLKDAGDIVKAGEPIATVGSSGGQDTPALYFAIRQQGHPSDPARWCRAQG